MTTTDNRPETLLQIAGAPPRQPRLDASVLVLIDAQQEYTTGRLPLDGIAPAVAEAGRLLALARARGVPVIHVVHHGTPGGPLFDPEAPTGRIVAEIAPDPGEAVVVKRLPNAFAGTDLRERLADLARASGREELILAGFMTHMCVGATARAALDLGLRATVVASATATRDLPDPLGGAVAAASVQRAALAALADRFALVVADVDGLVAADAAAG